MYGLVDHELPHPDVYYSSASTVFVL
jgi:hypothetical protein